MDFTKLIGNYIEAASIYNVQEEGDYIKDGLLYCGKCNTPKQCRIKMSDSESIVYCMCQCRAEQVREEDELRRKAELEEIMRAFKSDAFAYKQWAESSFDQDDGENPELTSILKNYATQFKRFFADGKGLLLYGPTGSGKSFGAACLANLLLDNGYTVRMTNFASISKEALSTFEKGQYFDNLLGCDLLILDDFAAERKTEYMNETVYDVINTRYENRLPMIITTNLTAEEIKHPADKAMQRVCSRLMASTIPIEVRGNDRRKSILRDEYGQYMSLLKGE